MPTVDITSPGGAFTPAAKGDAQELTTTWTITSGAPTTLICTGGTPFVSGDVGKSFFLEGFGSGGASGVQLGGTITGFTSSSQVTIDTAATHFLTASSQYFAWGTDDTAAWVACNTWAKAQTSPITVNLGSVAKKFLIFSGDFTTGTCIAAGVTNQPITIQGLGSASTRVINGGVGGVRQAFQDGDGVAKFVNSIAVGDTQATLKTISDASDFVVGQWLMIGGLNMQNAGAPMNLFWFEYVQIASVNLTTGVIGFATPAVNAYKDTWPIFSDTDNGGPAALFPMHALWYLNVTYKGISSTGLGGQTYTKGYSFNFIDYVSDSITPTQCYFVQFTGCDLTAYEMEYDKCVFKCVIDSTATGQLFLQSCNNILIIQNGSNIERSLNGCCRFTEVHDSTIQMGVGFGANGFGRMDSFITTNSTINGGCAIRGPGDSNIQSLSTMANGIITYPKANLTYGCTWQIPGSICFFTGSAGPPFFFFPSYAFFKILDVTDDATNIYIHTDWPNGGFPSWVLNGGSVAIITTPFMNFAANTVTDTPDIANFVASCAAGYFRPYTYSVASFVGGGIGTVSTGHNQTFTQAVGKLVSYTIDVTTPYTGVNASLPWHATATNDRLCTVLGDMSVVPWGAVIDLRTAGSRTMTPLSANPLGGDSGLQPPGSPCIITQAPSLGANVDITAEYNANPAVGPVVNTVMITDQSTGVPFAVTPLRLRLHA